MDLRRSLDAVAKAHNTVAVISAGWDPGSDSVVRALLEAMVPKGITYTNFGPGMSMGHTVAVKAIEATVKRADILPVTLSLSVLLYHNPLCSLYNQLQMRSFPDYLPD